MRKFNSIRQVAPMCPYGRTRCRDLSNNIEPSVYGNNAPYVKLLWPLIIFGHADLGSRTRQPSDSSRVLYCGHSTQYSHLVWFWDCFAWTWRPIWNDNSITVS